MRGLFTGPLTEDEARLQAEWMALAAGIPDKADPAWKGSPFAAFKQRSPSVTGSMFERLLAAWLTMKGLDVMPRVDPSHDRLVEGRRLEIKGATVTPARKFVFNQLRDQDYDGVVLIGLTPHRARVWVERKLELWELARPQHSSGRETRMLVVGRDWIGPQTDGTLVRALEVLRCQDPSASSSAPTSDPSEPTASSSTPSGRTPTRP